ncbi:MAG: HAD family hydrolase [Polyangiaceae bacterium]|nr:HAD family hydrolase [Polyangiaceae bacterium]
MNRLLIILDLDETLVHVTESPPPWRPHFTVRGYAGYRRPHLDTFLAELRGRYDLAVWTAAGRTYAEAVLTEVMPWHAELAFLWCADRCTEHFDHETRSHNTIKKIEKVTKQGYDLARVLVVDDSPEKHLKNYGNLIHIKPFLGDPSDEELPVVARYIHSLEDEPNVRAIEKRNWRAGHR